MPPPWNRYVAQVTYYLFAGCGEGYPGDSRRYSSIPDDVANNPCLTWDDVIIPSECPVATDSNLWYWNLGGQPAQHNHPPYGRDAAGYLTPAASDIYEGQGTVFFDGHAEWRDPGTVADVSANKIAEGGFGIYSY